jgi:hypothetical protein
MEAILDYDLGIFYTPGKANVMADALSHKSYCNNLLVQQHQPLLYEELRKKLEIVPQGYLNTLVVEPDLGDTIKSMRKYDPEVQKIKHYLVEESPRISLLMNMAPYYSRVA